MRHTNHEGEGGGGEKEAKKEIEAKKEKRRKRVNLYLKALRAEVALKMNVEPQNKANS